MPEIIPRIKNITTRTKGNLDQKCIVSTIVKNYKIIGNNVNKPIKK
jgi:hypothetical protein